MLGTGELFPRDHLGQRSQGLGGLGLELVARMGRGRGRNTPEATPLILARPSPGTQPPDHRGLSSAVS